MANNKDSKWYMTNGAIITLLVVFFPVGIYLMWKYADWQIRIKYVVSVVLSIAVIGIVASSHSPQTKTVTSSTTTSKTAPVRNQTNKKASYQATLQNSGNQDPTSMTFPTGGWDSNAGWDTAPQADKDNNTQSSYSAGSTIIFPAVTELNSHELAIEINVENTGSTAGAPYCFVQASSSMGSQFDTGTYQGYNYKTITVANKAGQTGLPIQPGSSGAVTDNLTISGQGALNIRQMKVSCS
jgi:hypothetical protein